MEDNLRGYACKKIGNVGNGMLTYGKNEEGSFMIKRYMETLPPAVEDKKEAVLPEYRDALSKLRHLQRIYQVFRKHCRYDGNLNVPYEVVRSDWQMYKVTRFVNRIGTDPSDFHSIMSLQQIDILFKTVLMQFEKFREMGFVHGDLKPENVIVSEKNGFFCGSVIDYDDGFFMDTIPDAEMFIGAVEYAAPEMYRYRCSCAASDSFLAKSLTTASDVFSLGLIYYYYLTGSMLSYGSLSPGEAICNDIPLRINCVDPVRKSLLQMMLSIDPARRPTAMQTLASLNAAYSSGLIERFSNPFPAIVSGYKVLPEPIPGCDPYLIRKAKKGRSCFILHYLDNEWLPIVFGGGNHCVLFEEQYICGMRRRQFRRDVAKKAALAAKQNHKILSYSIAEEKMMAYAVVKMPRGRMVALSQMHQEVPSIFLLDVVMYELLNAVQTLHDNGMLRGSISPLGICFVETNGRYEPFISDAFCCFPADNIPPPEDISLDPAYLSPEIGMYAARGESALKSPIAALIKPAADIFSLGLIYHTILTGHMPSVSIEEGTAYRAVACGRDDDALQLDPSLDKGHRMLIRCMLRCQPKERPQSCREAAGAIVNLYGDAV